MVSVFWLVLLLCCMSPTCLHINWILWSLKVVCQPYGFLAKNIKFWRWPAPVGNHRRFMIKCLKNNIIPVSIKLKTSIFTRKANEIIRRAERQLLNEHVRTVNNMLEFNMFRRETYFHAISRGFRSGYHARV